ncbi:MAG: hypothetical protein ACTHLN_00125 [Tepidisphaeraceae bacterium]
MSLRGEINAYPETLTDLDRACALRWREGDSLSEQHQYPGSVYLLGYVVEMRLKLASFRLLGARPHDPAEVQRHRVDAWMRQYAPHVPKEGGHNVIYWAAFIQLYRLATGRPLDLRCQRALRRHVYGAVYHDWKVEMRYRDSQSDAEAAWRLWSAAWWIEENWLTLYAR